VDDKLNSFNQCTQVKGTPRQGIHMHRYLLMALQTGLLTVLARLTFGSAGSRWAGVPSRPLGTIGILGLRVGEPLTVTPIFLFSNKNIKIKKSQRKGMLVVCCPAAAAQTEMRFLLEKAVRLTTRLQIPKINPTLPPLHTFDFQIGRWEKADRKTFFHMWISSQRQELRTRFSLFEDRSR
jgi:hypothetical protein